MIKSGPCTFWIGGVRSLTATLVLRTCADTMSACNVIRVSFMLSVFSMVSLSSLRKDVERGLLVLKRANRAFRRHLQAKFEALYEIADYTVTRLASVSAS